MYNWLKTDKKINLNIIKIHRVILGLIDHATFNWVIILIEKKIMATLKELKIR